MFTTKLPQPLSGRPPKDMPAAAAISGMAITFTETSPATSTTSKSVAGQISAAYPVPAGDLGPLAARPPGSLCYGSDARVPYYLLPWLGNGSTLRGYSTGRSGTGTVHAVFGRVEVVPEPLCDGHGPVYGRGNGRPTLQGPQVHQMKYDYGIGVRFHGPAVTALRFDVAHGTRDCTLFSPFRPLLNNREHDMNSKECMNMHEV